MKKISLLLLFSFLTIIGMISCEKEEVVDNKNQGNNQVDNNDLDKLPDSFMVDIPSSISRAMVSKSINEEVEYNPTQIYNNMGTFINVGEKAAEVIQEIINGIRSNNINKAMDLMYVSQEDMRQKHLVVVENVSFEGVDYQFQLTITDKDSETGLDGGKGLQVFWNTSPVKGVAIIKPYNVNRNDLTVAEKAMFRVDYSEAKEFGYDKHMIVQCADLKKEGIEDLYVLGGLKMFVGQSGDNVDVYGNSDHPNATFITPHVVGYDWAFVASGSKTKDYGVVEIGLMENTVNSTDRNVILKDNSLEKTFEKLYIEYYGENPLFKEFRDQALLLAKAPAYFDNNGFKQNGTSPGSEWDAIYARTLSLTPYNPTDIAKLKVSFK